MFGARLSGTGSSESEKVDIQALVWLDRILAAAARRREAKITVYVFYWLNACFYGVFDRSRGRFEAGCARARPREGGRREEDAPSARTLGDPWGRWRGPRHPGRSLVMTNLPEGGQVWAPDTPTHPN